MDVLFGGGCEGGNAVSKFFERLGPGMAPAFGMGRPDMQRAQQPQERDAWAAEFADASAQQQSQMPGFADAMSAFRGFASSPGAAAAAAHPPSATTDALSAAWSSAQRSTGWASEFAAATPAQSWAAEFAEQNVPRDADGVPSFGVEGEAHATFEEREAQSLFGGFMRAVKAQEVTVTDAGVFTSDGEPVVASEVGAAHVAAGTTTNGGEQAAARAGGPVLDDPTAALLAEAWAGATDAPTGPILHGRGAVGDGGASAAGGAVGTSAPAGEWDGLLSDAWGTAGLEGVWSDAMGGAGAAAGTSAQAQGWADQLFDRMGGPAWADELSSARAGTYEFAESNPFTDHADPIAEAAEATARGDVADAVLAYEAAVVADPTSVAGWVGLGHAQAQNERDDLAISAFQKAVDLDPQCRAAHFGMAVSHANEGNIVSAVDALTQWVKTHPLAGEMDTPLVMATEGVPWWESSMAQQAALRSRVQEYLSRTDATDSARVELLMVLGILHHLAREFGDAADAFRAALQLEPRSAQLWNKLGATLTNSATYADGRRALHRALELRPGYVRAMCNLGALESNFGNHDVALKKWLYALLLQQRSSAASPHRPNRPQSSALWQNVRTVVALLGRGDLLSHAMAEDLSAFKEEFDLPL